MAKKKKVFLVDGSALLYRSFFAFIKNPLINSKGVNTSAVYGFASTLMKVLKEEKPDFMVVVFDSPEPTFRHKKYPLYKATREKMPDELIEQIPVVEEIIQGFNIPLIRQSGIEADDLIATMAFKAKEKDFFTYIVTADKDFFQIVSDRIKIYNLRSKAKDTSGKYIDASGVVEKLGIPPEKVVDYLSIVGDSSDNIPGIRGVGAKTAQKILNQYASADEMIENIDKINPESLREKIRNGLESFYLSRSLIEIKTDITISLEVEDCKILPWNRSQLSKLFHDMEFTSLLKSIAHSEKEEILSYKVVTADEAMNIAEILKGKEEFSFNITSLQGQGDDFIFGISFSCMDKEAYFFPKLESRKDPLLQTARNILEDKKSKKICHDAKKQLHLASRLGIRIENIYFDSMLASFLLNPSSREPDIAPISIELLDFHKKTFEEITGKSQKKTDPMELSEEEVSLVSMENADILFRLTPLLMKKLEKENMLSLFFHVEMPLLQILYTMEQRGIKIDVSCLKELSQKLGKMIFDLESEIFDETGIRFNLNSPKQLGEVLFEKLNIQSMVPRKRVKKSKTGYSTSQDVLSEYMGIPLVEKILRHRSFNKLKNTYIDTLPQLCDPEDGRLHTRFHQAITQTGRLSSTHPNLQNIPIRSEEGSLIRKAFIAEEGYRLVSADYSQIELRILAHLSHDRKLIDAFEKGKDIHTQTASLIFHISEDQVTPAFRSKAKAINFGIVYGMGPRKLSKDTGISLKEANTFINEYFLAHGSVRSFIERAIEETRKSEVSRTLMGRIRHIPEINSTQPRIRSSAENMAVNTPIQGSAADIIKVAMINIEEKIIEKDLKARMLLQVHDELIFEVQENDVDSANAIIEKEMISAVSLKVPLVVKVKSGTNWLECD